MVLHCTEPFIKILPSSKNYLNKVERDVKQQAIVIKAYVVGNQKIREKNHISIIKYIIKFSADFSSKAEILFPFFFSVIFVCKQDEYSTCITTFAP